MESPVFTAKSFPQYLALIGSQFALRKHKLRYWACARCMHLIPECIFEHAQKTDAPELRTIVEVMFSHFVADHNLQAAIAGPCCSLFPRMLPDSTIAKAMKCRRGRQRWYWRVGGDCPYYRPKAVPTRSCLCPDESTDRNTDTRVTILARQT